MAGLDERKREPVLADGGAGPAQQPSAAQPRDLECRCWPIGEHALLNKPRKPIAQGTDAARKSCS